MKMKCINLPGGDMVSRGSVILNKIHDMSTPPVDLVVRESIQNALDEIRDDCAFGRVEFFTNTFQKIALSATMPTLEAGINKLVKETVCHYLAIVDTNTNGLLGEPYYRKDKPNNLYNLVYDIDSNDKKYSAKGGSWGIGKSVYYRYGIGLVFYYSRTLEDGKYIEKLAGVLVQDETEPTCLLGPDSRGICYIGDEHEHEGKLIRWPVYDEQRIGELLAIFKIDRFVGNATGTKVIIPFIDYSSLLGGRVYEGEDLHWISSSFKDCFSMAIQRWWFPRLNNPDFKEKPFIAAVEGQKVELNAFFLTLQQLYKNSLTLKEAMMFPIIDKKSGSTATLGYLHCLKGDKKAFQVETPPDNLSNPFAQVDVQPDSSSSNPVIFAYMRAFGLIVNYDITKYKYKVTTDPGEYIIALFVLNDDAKADGTNETLGRYLKASEMPNHKEWMDITHPKFPVYSSKKPFAKIFKRIRGILEDNYTEQSTPDETFGPAILRRKIGKLLLPPSDFGNEPEKEEKPKGGSKISVSKKRPYRVSYKGIIGDLLCYSVSFRLEPNEIGKAELNVVTNGGNFSIIDWERNGFSSPVRIEKVSMMRAESGKDSVDGPYQIPKDKWGTNVKFKIKAGGDPAYELRVSAKTPNATTYCLFAKNLSTEEIKLEFQIFVKPLNLTYQMTLVGEIKEGN